MTVRQKAVFNWSGGKDSALALQHALNSGRYEIISLLSVVRENDGQTPLHGIPVDLLRLQAASIGLPLVIVDLKVNHGTVAYGSSMESCIHAFKEQGADHFIFGDLFLEEVRTRREEKLHPYGIRVVEPLWGKPSAEVMEDFLHSGVQAVVVATASRWLDNRHIGQMVDRPFINSLPPEVDVCGEYGEYHTFCFAGGPFRKPVGFSLGKPRRTTYPAGNGGHEDDGSPTCWAAGLRTSAGTLTGRRP